MTTQLCAPKNVRVTKLTSDITVDNVYVNTLTNDLVISNVVVNKIGCKNE